MSQQTPAAKEASTDSIPIPAALGAFLDVAGRVVAFASLLTALLFYFGYVRTNALFLHFGIDPSALKLTTEDYLLRSIRGMSEPLRWLLIGVLAFIWLHFVITRGLAQSDSSSARRRTTLVWLSCLLGLIVSGGNLVLIWGAVMWPMPPLFYPLTWMLGIGLIGYGVYLSSPATSKDKRADNIPYAPVRRSSLWVFAGLLLHGLTWAIAVYAEEDGLYRARQIAYYLESQPSVTVYSKEDLHIRMPAVSVDQDCNSRGECWSRYRGLKFLMQSNDRYFLLPADWEPQQGRAVVLPETDAIRIEFAPGTAPVFSP